MIARGRVHAFVLLFVVSTCSAQTAQITSNGVTNTEPGVYRLSELFLHADTVALVKVVSGDAEAYEIPIYKGRVIQAFKGARSGDFVYFGPYLRTELGSEYILFLKSTREIIQPKQNAVAAYGSVKYSIVFDEGYSSMLTSYECVFDGVTVDKQCDYAVRVCTDYIKLPKSLPTSAPEPSFGCKWVKRDDFIHALSDLRDSNVENEKR